MLLVRRETHIIPAAHWYKYVKMENLFKAHLDSFQHNSPDICAIVTFIRLKFVS